jgi:hypothetical protein
MCVTEWMSQVGLVVTSRLLGSASSERLGEEKAIFAGNHPGELRAHFPGYEVTGA